MEIHHTNFVQKYSRKFYRLVVPESIRARISDTGMLIGLRESIQNGNNSMPYVLLSERHMANVRVVMNRNAMLGALPQNGIVAEIGVNRGDFSRRILTYNKPKELHLVDVWDSRRYHEGLMTIVTDKFQTELSDGTIQIHRGYSFDVMPTFEDGMFDWVYIDTDHSYETTKRELEIAQHKVKPGGIIAGHDYITGDWKLRIRYGVVEAVNEFCVKHDWEFVLLTHETHRHVSYAIRKIQS